VRFVHDRTVEGMNDGVDVQTLMPRSCCHTELEVGQGYGKVSWDVRDLGNLRGMVPPRLDHRAVPLRCGAADRSRRVGGRRRRRAREAQARIEAHPSPRGHLVGRGRPRRRTEPPRCTPSWSRRTRS
jgi:hypothetical protein